MFVSQILEIRTYQVDSGKTVCKLHTFIPNDHIDKFNKLFFLHQMPYFIGSRSTDGVFCNFVLDNEKRYKTFRSFLIRNNVAGAENLTKELE